MIIKGKKHDSIYALLKYMTDKPGFILVDSTLLNDPDNISACAKEFKERFAMGRGKQPLKHIIVSIHKNDKLALAAFKSTVRRVGKVYKNDLWYAGMHTEKEHIHCHIAMCMVHEDGKMADTKNDFRKLRVLAQSIEKEHGITATPYISERNTLQVSKEELEKGARMYREGLKAMPTAERQDMKAELMQIVQDAWSFTELDLMCAAAGYKVNYRKKGDKIQGLSFSKGRLSIKAGDLGTNYFKLKERYARITHEDYRIRTSRRITCMGGTNIKSYRRFSDFKNAGGSTVPTSSINITCSIVCGILQATSRVNAFGHAIKNHAANRGTKEIGSGIIANSIIGIGNIFGQMIAGEDGYNNRNRSTPLDQEW